MNTTRQKILNSDCLKTKKLHIKQWDCDVYIKQFSVRTQLECSDWVDKTKDAEKDYRNINCKMIICCTYDDEGERLFTQDDYDFVFDQPISVINYLADEINLINQDDKIETKAKNS